MKLTVGPLPAAVYWRRRAVVLGVVLVVILWIGYACAGSGSGANPASGDGKPKSGPVVYPSEEPSEEPPPHGGDPGDPSADPSVSPSSSTGGGSNATVPACADADLKIVPRPAHTRTPEGARLRIDLVITNVSERACERDIGADHQEVKLVRDGKRTWSSDDCHPQTGSHVEALAPDKPIERFWVTWDGRTSAPKCEGQRTVAQSGSYTVVARLGNLTSDPVALKVVEPSS